MKAPSNQDLENKINHLEKKVDNKHSAVLTKLNKFEKTITEELKTFHDFMIIRQDREKYMKVNGKFNSGKIIEELIKVLVISLTIIGTLVGTGAIK